MSLVAAPGPPPYILGPGAGLTTPFSGQLVPAGKQPSLTASFDPWWLSVAGGLRLQTSIRSAAQAEQGINPAATTIKLPTTASALASIPIVLPKVGPGAYEVDARLLDSNGNAVGATCLYLTVASSSDRLNLATLPGTPDFGGPSDDRAVALSDELGTGGARVGVDWTKLLPGGATSTAAEDFSAYDSAFQAAAAQAKQRGTSWWVQVGQGGATEKALVANGTWGQRVGELIAHFKGVVPAWEAWNEPNNTYGSASDYVTNILAPFSQAVRANDPAAQVIGGSTLGVATSYWQGIANAGGLADMDVAAIHPYTGHDRSWEEQGTVADIKSLQAVIGSKPLWDTESAWWSDGPASIFSQADKAARASIWMKTLGMGPWSYFITEGGYGDYGFSYSVIQSDGTPDNYVKPAALALETVSTELAGRTFLGMVNTGIPHAYAARFSASATDSHSLLAAWTDDATIPVHLTVTGSSVPVTDTDEYGATVADTLHSGTPVGFALTPSVSYLTFPTAGGLGVVPAATYGKDVAKGSGVTASTSAQNNPANAAVDGVDDAGDGGDLPGLSAWASTIGDNAPTLTATLSSPTTINRIDVVSSSISSVVPGLRDYDIDVGNGGSFTTVGTVRNDVTQRTQQVDFAPTAVTQIRLRSLRVATTGFAGGDRPWFWPQQGADQAVVFGLEAFAGSQSLATLQDRDVRAFGAPLGTTGSVTGGNKPGVHGSAAAPAKATAPGQKTKGTIPVPPTGKGTSHVSVARKTLAYTGIDGRLLLFGLAMTIVGLAGASRLSKARRRRG